VLGRFVPIVRTFITLVAGVGRMQRRHFYVWSALGAVLWAVGVTLLGYFLGTIPVIRRNIELMLIAIVLVSVVPMVVEVLRARRKQRSTTARA
jgi:membrane-associated protein